MQTYFKDSRLDPEFRELSWFGFCAADRPAGVYAVDNLRLEAVAP